MPTTLLTYQLRLRAPILFKNDYYFENEVINVHLMNSILLERLLLILGVSSIPAVSVQLETGVKKSVDLEVGTDTSYTGQSTLGQPGQVHLEPPEDDPHLPVPEVARPGVVFPQLGEGVPL